MARFKGRSSLKQYVHKNPLSKVLKCGVGPIVRMGILVLFKFMLENREIDSTEKNLGARVVKDLAEDIQGKLLLLLLDNLL